METMKVILAFLLIMFFSSGFAQESSKKAQREKSRIEKQHQVESLINSKEFVFTATRALPQDGNSIDLTTNTNYLKFHPEKIESYMPFFGRAYSADYGGDGGIKFTGKPQDYKLVNGKKGFEISATVAVAQDNYKLALFVSPEGSATLTIISNRKSSISYFGAISNSEESGEE